MSGNGRAGRLLCRLRGVVFIAFMLAAAGPSRGAVYFRNAGNLSGWNNISTDANCYLSAVSSPAYNNSGGAIESHCEYEGSGVRYHAEPTTYGNWNSGTTYFGYALYLPSTWQFTGTERNVTEQYGTETNNSVIVPDYYQAWVGGGTANAYQFSAISNSMNNADENSGTMTAGVWHTIVTKMTYGSGGSVTVWFDGNLAWTQSGTINGGGGGSPPGLWAVGLYEADWDGGNTGGGTNVILYNAAITIASDYDDANPANAFAAPEWNGGSATDSDWSDDANWGGAIIGADGDLSFGGNSRLTNTNNTTAGTTYNDLAFLPNAGAFNLNGNYISLAGNITNLSASLQTNNLSMTIAENPILNAGTAGMVIGGGITNTSATWYTIHLQGTNGTLAGSLQSSAAGEPYNLALVLDAVAGASNSWSILGNNTSYLTNLTVAGLGNVTLGSGSDAPALAIANDNGVALQVGGITNVASYFTMNSGTLALTNDNNAPLDLGLGGSLGVFNLNGGSLFLSGKYLQIGDAGGTGIFNQNGGTVTTAISGDIILGNSINNSTGIVNLASGTFNATANNDFFVGFRGQGTWNLSGNGLLEVQTLHLVRASTDSANASGTLNLNGGTVVMNGESMTGAASTPQTGVINFNGGVLQAGAGSTTFLSPATPPAALSTVVKSGGAIINDGGYSITISSPLAHDSTLGAAKDGGLIKQGGGTLTLSATNTYTGNTTIGAGILALIGSGSISNSSNIIIAGSATFDVSGLSSFMLGSSQTLSNSGPAAVLACGAGGAATGSGTVSLTYASGQPALLATNGVLTLSSNTVFRINNYGTALAPGTYAIITNASSGNIGAVAVANGLPPVTVSGGGIAAGATAALQISGGALDLVVAPGTIIPSVSPGIVSFSLVGGNVVINGTNGVNGGTYYLLSCTNVALPFGQWTSVATNQVSVSGGPNNFTFTGTNTVSPHDAQRFYILSNTNE